MAGKAKQLLQNAVSTQAAETKDGDRKTPHSQSGVWQAPGRLGDDSLAVGTDPRANARMMELFPKLGMDKRNPVEHLDKLTADSSLDDMAVMIEEFEKGIEGLYYGLPFDLPGDKETIDLIKREDHTIKGGDGQDMLVHIYRPKDQSGALPCVDYTHGGGMVVNKTINPIHEAWAKTLASHGVVVAMPDYRNAWIPNKESEKGYDHFPFPAGLNDCAAALKWLAKNKGELKITNIITQGESGGANLAIATALKANREGWIHDISGVYGVVPYISGAYGWPEERKLKELPSLVECHEYFISSHASAFMAHFYTPTDERAEDPLAWPYWATLEDMKGLPPHILVMDELDPLKDEGISFARRLAKAGVEVKGSVNLGVTHGTSLILRKQLPEYHLGAVREIVAFAKSLS